MSHFGTASPAHQHGHPDPLCYLIPYRRLTLSQQLHAAAVQQFANTDMVRANEEVVLLLPFTPGHASNRWSSPELDPLVAQLWGCQQVADGAAELLGKYR